MTPTSRHDPLAPMQPGASVILRTTLIGAGQGLFIAVFAVELSALFGFVAPPIVPWFYFYGALLSFAFTLAALVASAFPLGRPSRAWRSASQRRTSWPSREAIVMPAFMAVTLVYAAAHFLNWNGPYGASAGRITDPTVLLGLAGVALALTLYVCTGMACACLLSLREWATLLTVNFTLLGLASGFTLAAAATLARPPLVRVYAACALALTLAGLLGRLASLRHNARLRPKSTLQTAIGIEHPNIAQTSSGFAAGFARPAKWLFLLAAFVVPALLLALSVAGAPRATIVVAFVVQFLGLVVERWHFFAQANRPQDRYYQAVA